MSHELRTPLNAILGFSDVLRFEMLGPLGNDKYQEYADDINRGGEHLRSMIDDLLDLSRIKNGRMPLNETLIDLPSLWREVETITAIKVIEAGMTMSARVPQSLPRLRADQRSIRQVLMNLIVNAANHSYGTRIDVTISLEDGRLVFRVCDDGRGISAVDIVSLKERFYRAEKPQNATQGGLGIGLSLVEAFVDLHGGTFDISNGKEKSAEFVIKFPHERTRFVEADIAVNM